MWSDWISELRPKTLFLGSSNCALGCALGLFYSQVNLYTITVSILIVLTGTLLQILSNFANDYGDAITGADKVGKRVGPIRTSMTGAMSLNRLRRGMAVVIICAAITGFLAVFMAAYSDLNVVAWFLFLGVISIIAAISYTVGIAYGYKSLGDFSVFIFFGLLAVLGSQILVTSAGGGGTEFYPDTLLLGCATGFASAMVLHVNNMRDISNDLIANKKTLAVRLGYKLSVIYHVAMLIAVIVLSFYACFLSHKGREFILVFIALIPLIASVVRVAKNVRNSEKIARELRFTVIGTFLHNIAWIIVLIIDYWFYL